MASASIKARKDITCLNSDLSMSNILFLQFGQIITTVFENGNISIFIDTYVSIVLYVLLCNIFRIKWFWKLIFSFFCFRKFDSFVAVGTIAIPSLETVYLFGKKWGRSLNRLLSFKILKAYFTANSQWNFIFFSKILQFPDW